MRILTASDRSLLVEAADLDEAMRLNLAWDGIPGIIERIPGARTVLVRFDPVRVSAAALAETLAATPVDAAHTPRLREVTIPVRYDGEDLAEAATLLGVTADELVNRHLAADWRVAFSGFAPGFGYLVSSDPLFDVPRRPSPRTRVPAGSVALAGAFTGVYPRESPGGWQLIGRTDAVMWDIDRDPPALLVPGTVVRFERVSSGGVEGDGGLRLAREGGLRLAALAQPVSSAAAAQPPLNDRGLDASPGGAWSGGSPGGALSERSETKRVERAAGESKPRPSIEIVHPALQLLIQDSGRPGRADLGVSASGAADRTAMRDANRAVGNDRDAAVLEIVGAAALRFHGDGVAVVTGAVAELSLTAADGNPRTIAPRCPVRHRRWRRALDRASDAWSSLRRRRARRGGCGIRSRQPRQRHARRSRPRAPRGR